jgi:Type II secretion system (T2SS), protein M subtype b
MNSPFSPKTQRVIALSILVSIIGLLWLAIVQPVLSHIDSETEQRGIALRALKRDRALLREEPAIQAAAAAVEQSPRWRNFYEDQKAESATLQLETDLRALFKDANNPTSMTAEPAVAQGAVTRIAVRLIVVMRVDDLAKILDRLQKHPRQLRIESLTIQAPENQNNQVNPLLNVQAEIAGWMVAPRAQRTRAP